MKYNNYYAELGFTPEDEIFSEGEEVLLKEDFFNLDLTIALFLYSRLRHFKDNYSYSYPPDLTQEKWKEFLNKMIEGFSIYIKTDFNVLSKNEQKKVKYGFKLFIKYFNQLWY